MNDLYLESMAAAVDRLYDEAGRRHRRRGHQREEDLLRRRQPQRDGQGDPGRRRGGLRDGRGVKAACAGSRPSRSRSSPRSTAPRSAAASRSRWPATTGSLVDDPKVEIGLPEASLGLLPGGGGVTRDRPDARHPDGLMDVLLQGTRFKPADAPRTRVSSTSSSPPARSWSRPPRPGSRPTRTPCQNPWDAPGYKMPGGTPKTPALAGFLPAFPALLRKQLKGADYPAQKAILSAAVEGAPGRLRHRLADRVALPDQPGRQPELEEHDPGVLLRPAGDQRRLAAPAGHRAVARRPRSACSAPG